MPRVILHGPSQRAYARRLIDDAPQGAVMRLDPPGRTLDQNAKMWAMLSDISKQKPEGREYTPEVWKSLFMHALGYEIAFAMGLNGEPFPLGFRSSRMTKAQMSDMIETMYRYGAEHGLVWSEETANV